MSDSNDTPQTPAQPRQAARPRALRRFRLRRNRYLGGLGKPRDAGADPGVDSIGLAGTVAAPGAVPSRRSRGIYLLPNAFTTGGLFAGFFAIVMAMNDRFETASIAIFVAMLLDSLDGRVARMTNTQSAFGEQYDSLADMVSFGAAPALVMYAWTLQGLGKWGWVAAFVYVAGAALRLARFNTNIGVVDKRFFQGLPSPAAAAMVAGLIWVVTDLRETRWITADRQDLAWVAWLVTIYAGVTMVTNMPFYSFKDLNLKRSVPFIFLVLLVLGFVLISSDPPVVLFLLFVVYGVSGYALWGWRRYRANGLSVMRRSPSAGAADPARASDSRQPPAQ